EPPPSGARAGRPGIVKGFRMAARDRREGMHGSKRPKSLEGGNRGGVRDGGGVDLWGFGAGAGCDLSVPNRDDGWVTSGALVLAALDAMGPVIWYSSHRVLSAEGGADGCYRRSVAGAGER